MMRFLVILAGFTLRETRSQNTPSAIHTKLASFFEIRSTDNYTSTMKMTRSPEDTSELTVNELDKILITLRPRGDGNAIRGKNREADAGKLSTATNNEIDKGKPLESGHFPWHAGINADGSYFCAGAMISNRHILTVATCVNEFVNFTITLGDIDRNQFERNVILMTTDSKLVHNNFELQTLAFNVALLILPISIATNGLNIKPVSLPKRSDSTKPFTKEKVYLTGWGFTNDGNYANALLTRANMTVADIGDCYKKYGAIINFQHLCTYSEVNTCFANDGSPLVYRDSDYTWNLLGLTQFRSTENCASGDPLVFFRVTAVLAWLSDKTSLAIRN
ncbi:serine protease 1-like isoform X1 [Cloeon dipterum]|uniref:serine protease 1-like isoform X1 n=1 Tax=Cloeon dipterum TaxID=197152 RepID=UPI0032201F32